MEKKIKESVLSENDYRGMSLSEKNNLNFIDLFYFWASNSLTDRERLELFNLIKTKNLAFEQLQLVLGETLEDSPEYVEIFALLMEKKTSFDHQRFIWQNSLLRTKSEDETFLNLKRMAKFPHEKEWLKENVT